MEHMEKRIELEKRGRPADEIFELNLDNCRSTQIAGLTEEFKNLKSLSLINVGLTTLKGFPNLPNLQKLELSDNRISNGLHFLNDCKELTYLNLSGNKIKDLETLEPLKNVKTLRNLDLFNCEVTNLENYREKVFETLTDLQYLDGYDKNDQEQEDDDDDEEGVMNGNGECSEDDSEGENSKDGEDDDDSDVDDDDEEDDEDDGEVGLSYLQRSGLEEESEGDDFNPDEDDSDDEDDELDDEDDEESAAGGEPGATVASRGVKRKEPDDNNEDDD